MTHFFPYDELTWPEVAALRRDTPLVIPLGEGYDLAQLAEALGDPASVGLLPPIPYGWPGSGLETAAAPFAQMVSNLLDSLQDDGFSLVYALHPQGLELGLGPRSLAQRHSSQLRLSLIHIYQRQDNNGQHFRKPQHYSYSFDLTRLFRWD